MILLLGLSAVLAAAAPADPLKPLYGVWSANFTCGQEKGTARLELKTDREKPGGLIVEYSSKIRIPGRMRYSLGRVTANASPGPKPGQYRFEVYRHEYNPIVDAITGTATASPDLKKVSAVTDHWPELVRGRWAFKGSAAPQTGLRTAVYSYELKTQGGPKECAGALVKR